MNAHVIDDVMSCVTAHRALSVATTSCACASFLCLFIAVTTDYWLYTVERLSDDNNTTTSLYLVMSSGLWRNCAHKRTSPSSPQKLPTIDFSDWLHGVFYCLFIVYAPRLSPLLKYYYFRFLETNVHCVGILLSVSIFIFASSLS